MVKTFHLIFLVIFTIDPFFNMLRRIIAISGTKVTSFTWNLVFIFTKIWNTENLDDKFFLLAEITLTVENVKIDGTILHNRHSDF